MKYNCILLACIISLTVLSLSSCSKFLDAKPDDKLSVPTNIPDLQLLMDDYFTMNNKYPYAQELTADNFYLETADWKAQEPLYRGLYNWQKNDQTLDQWTAAYEAVLSANVVLDNIDDVEHSISEQTAWNNVKGSALFFRSLYFHGLAQIFALPYNRNTAAADKCIPLRLNGDYTQVSVRATTENTYQQIITDLQQAIALLPVTPTIKSRPSKPAAYGLLARVYMDMQEYAKAGAYADSCLLLYNRLMDYNTLDAAAEAPIARFNDEVIFEAVSTVITPLTPAVCRIDTTLYNSYDVNDLRKEVYFNNTGYTSFKGDYRGQGSYNGYVFAGIVTDEMYLVSAESYARAGNTAKAMDMLNVLLVKRWRTGTFVPLTAVDANDALRKILIERRKELLFRGARWADLRRLKDDPQFSVTPVRVLDGQTFELLPNSPRYALQLPSSVIEMTNMPQNP